jgi:hypothetical protein
LTLVPISVLTGRFFFLSAGVTANSNGIGGAVGEADGAAWLLLTNAGAAVLPSLPQAVMRVSPRTPAAEAARILPMAA